jgi:tetratricopeptide (TPR) repeat protein
MKHAVAAASVVLLLAWSSYPALAQVAADPKAAFFQSLARFSVALDGQFGDEGRDVRAALEGMVRGLDAWDSAIRASESSFARSLPGSAADAAARMHIALGAAYLDRSRLPDALRELAAGVALDPARADGFVFLGVAQDQAAGDFEGAVTSYRHATELDRANPVDAYLLARALDKSGRHADALEAFQTVLRVWREGAGAQQGVAHDVPFIRLGLLQERSGVEPFFPPVLYADGFALLQRGEFAKAVEVFTQNIADDSLVRTDVDPRDALGIGASAFRRGDVDSAVRALAIAVEREPDRAEAHRQLGRALLANGKNDDAVKELHLAVRLAPRDERTSLTLADALVQLRRYPDAESAFRDALTAFPRSGRARYKLARLYQRQNKTVEALAEYDAAAARAPLIGANRVLQAIGALNGAQQNFDAAVRAYSLRVDIHPNDADAHRVLGYMYSRLDRRDEAFAEFAVALWIAPATPDVHVAMSQLHLKSSEYAAAADAARRALMLNPSNKQAHYSLGTALMRLEQPDEAKAQFDAFERLQEQDTAASARQMTINALRREAAASLESHDAEHAAGVLRKALELAPASFEIHEQLAAVYTALGRREDSERELTTASELRADALAREADR